MLQATCQVPAELWVDLAATQPVTLPAAPPGQAAATAQRNLYIANKGNASLVVSLQAVPRSDSVLRPQLWLDPSTGYNAEFNGQAAAAGYKFSDGTESRAGSVTVTGSEGTPARYAQPLPAPLRLRAQMQRDRPCSNHFLALSIAGTPPTQPGGAQLSMQLSLQDSSICKVVFPLLIGWKFP